MAAPKVATIFLLLVILTQTHPSSASLPPNRGLLGSARSGRPRVPSCNDLSSKPQCTQNPNCRWCTSEALDDMCFSKPEAWRLPQQVFLCN